MHLIEDTSQLDIGKLKKVYVSALLSSRTTSFPIATSKPTFSTKQLSLGSTPSNCSAAARL